MRRLPQASPDDVFTQVFIFPGGPSSRQDLYAFFLARGLEDRARTFRRKIDQKQGAAFDANFQAVDKDPEIPATFGSSDHSQQRPPGMEFPRQREANLVA